MRLPLGFFISRLFVFAGAVAGCSSHIAEGRPDGLSERDGASEADAGNDTRPSAGQMASADAATEALPRPADREGPGCTAPIELLAFAARDYGIGTAPTTLALGTDYTIEAWIYATVADATGLVFCKWRDGAEDKTLGLADGLVSLRVRRGSDYVQLDGNTRIGAGTWHHVAGSVGGGTAHLFIDGKLDVELPVASAPSADSMTPIWIGSMVRGESQMPALPGYISDVRVSSLGRYTLRFAPALRLAADADTLALWHIDDGEPSTTVRDSGPQSLDGTIAGAPWWITGPPRCASPDW